MFRASVRTLLEREGGFEVVEADSFDDALDAIALECPDIVLLDLELPPFGGVAAVQQLARACGTYAIVWGFEPSRATVLTVIRSGAHGFLLDYLYVTSWSLGGDLRLQLRTIPAACRGS